MWTTSNANSEFKAFQANEPWFLRDTLYVGTHYANRYGISGTPVPTTLRQSDAVTLLLLLCFAAFIVSVSKLWRFIVRQAKSFFYPTHAEAQISETSSELRFLLFLVFVNCMLLAIGIWIYVTEIISEDLSTDNPLIPIGILTAVFIIYYLVRWGLYSMVNLTFFDSKKNLHWIKILIFLTAAEGVLLFPVAVMLIYFGFAIENALIYFGFILFLNKLLTFYQCWIIFFRQKGGLLQFILYLCALEITPLLALGGIGMIIINTAKINY